MKVIRTGLAVINKAEEIVLSVVLMEMALLTFVQVVLRYVFGDSITWVEEFVRYQLCFVTFFGADLGVKYGSHIGAEIIGYALPKQFKPLLKAFIFFMVFLFCLFFAYYGLMLVIKVHNMGQMTAALGIPKYWVYLPIPVGGGFMCIRSLYYGILEFGKFLLLMHERGTCTA